MADGNIDMLEIKSFVDRVTLLKHFCRCCWFFVFKQLIKQISVNHKQKDFFKLINLHTSFLLSSLSTENMHECVCMTRHLLFSFFFFCCFLFFQNNGQLKLIEMKEKKSKLEKMRHGHQIKINTIKTIIHHPKNKLIFHKKTKNRRNYQKIMKPHLPWYNFHKDIS